MPNATQDMLRQILDPIIPADTAPKHERPDVAVKDAIIATLAELGKINPTDDDLVFNGTKFILPAQYRENMDGALDYLRKAKQQRDAPFHFSRQFPYRPWDGAAAFQRAMRRVFGTTGIGKTEQTFFGPQPPQRITISVGAHEQLQIPWGRVVFGPLEAEFQLGAVNSEDGVVFNLVVEAPLKYRHAIEGFMSVVEDELKERSIYRGKAVVGVENPTFLDLDTVDPDRVVYSDEVLTQLETNMWSLLRHAESMRRNKIPLKRAVMLEGPYGTGKTLAGQLTALEAVRNGWTFILAKPGKDSLTEVFATAKLYAPTVVWWEDLDVVGQGSSDVQISELLDALDGATAKGHEILAGFTTNQPELIQQGIWRPGRLDATIHIGELDDRGIEKLCKVAIPQERQRLIDFSEVTKAFDSETMRLPAFVAEAAGRAMRYSIARNNGELAEITTADLVHAANGLRPQVKLMDDARRGVVIPTVDKALKELVLDTVDGVKVLDYDDDPNGRLARHDA